MKDIEKSKKLGIISLSILGGSVLLSILLFFLSDYIGENDIIDKIMSGLMLCSLIIGPLAGFVLGIIARHYGKTTVAILALVLSALYIVLGILFCVLVVWIVCAACSSLNDNAQGIQDFIQACGEMG